MIPKPIRRAPFGHAGTRGAVVAGVPAILTLLNPARTSFASLISTVRRSYRWGAGPIAIVTWAVRHPAGRTDGTAPQPVWRPRLGAMARERRAGRRWP